jgi:monothiol glutaredoxin
MDLDPALHARLDALVHAHPVVLFMKGERRAPACGFSAAVVEILDGLRVDYHTVDVFSDPAVRDGIKLYSNWPTLPQLFIRGEFVGGCDIVRALSASGELATLLGMPAPAVPSVTVSPRAAEALAQASAEEGGVPVHVEISPAYEYELFLGPARDGEVEVRTSGVVLRFDGESARRADGLSIDLVDGPEGGFRIRSPQEPVKVRQLSAEQLKAMIDRGERFELFDVRTPHERELAKIEGSRLLDLDGQDYLLDLDRETPLVFQCHHGIRSQAAAEYAVREGFRTVFNLRGGIDAWSLRVDPMVPRY